MPLNDLRFVKVVQRSNSRQRVVHSKARGESVYYYVPAAGA